MKTGLLYYTGCSFLNKTRIYVTAVTELCITQHLISTTPYSIGSISLEHKEVARNKIIFSRIVPILPGKGLLGVPTIQTAVIPFSVGKKLIKRHLQLDHQPRQNACTGCRQSKTLMVYPLSSRANVPLPMSRLRLRAAVGLLTGHTTLTAHLYKLGHTER
jgi:hypothetical protein